MQKKIKIEKNLSWKELKALNDLYTKEKSQAKVQEHDYIKYLIEDVGLIERKLGNSKILIPTEDFKEFYQSYLNDNFHYYNNFLESADLNPDARKNYDEYDIKTLMFIQENKAEISGNLTNIKIFSTDIFEGKGSKYLEGKPGLAKDVCKILEIDEFPNDGKTDHQWRFVIDCINPIAIVLCENLTFLKCSWIAKKNSIKLWYVGGNNTRILDDINIEEFNRPIFYSCDWDHAGLKIYNRIKKKIQARNKEIKLLYPNQPHRPLPVNSPHHKSKWRHELFLSGLNNNDFNETEKDLIQSLMNQDLWLEEEYNDLVQMLTVEMK